VKGFDQGKLKKVSTNEKNTLPTSATLHEELRPEKLPDVSGVAGFERDQLKTVYTRESAGVPTQDEINAEIAHSRAEVKTFDMSKLKSTTPNEGRPEQVNGEVVADLREPEIPADGTVEEDTTRRHSRGEPAKPRPRSRHDSGSQGKPPPNVDKSPKKPRPRSFINQPSGKH